MITYVPLSMRSGHTASSTAAASHRAWTRTQRYEDAIIGRIDQDRRNAKVAAEMARHKRDWIGRLCDPGWVLRVQ